MRTRKRANALTRTRESPMERLFRGITWLLGNSVALPRRPAYFRLQYLFVLVCVCVFARLPLCSHVHAAQLLACVLFYVYLCCMYVCRSLCVVWCVCYSEWCLGMLCRWMLFDRDINASALGGWGWGVQGAAIPESCKSNFSWGDPFFLPLLPVFLYTEYILQINFLSLSSHFLPRRNVVILLCAMFTTYCTSLHPTAHLFVWNNNKIGFCYYITSSFILSKLHWFQLFPVSSGADVH